MVRFGAQLEAHIVPDWREHYIDYEGLTSALHAMRLGRSTSTGASSSQSHPSSTGMSGANPSVCDSLWTSSTLKLRSRPSPLTHDEEEGQRLLQLRSRGNTCSDSVSPPPSPSLPATRSPSSNSVLFLETHFTSEARKVERHYLKELSQLKGRFSEIRAYLSRLGLYPEEEFDSPLSAVEVEDCAFSPALSHLQHIHHGSPLPLYLGGRSPLPRTRSRYSTDNAGVTASVSIPQSSDGTQLGTPTTTAAASTSISTNTSSSSPKPGSVAVSVSTGMPLSATAPSDSPAVPSSSAPPSSISVGTGMGTRPGAGVCAGVGVSDVDMSSPFSAAVGGMSSRSRRLAGAPNIQLRTAFPSRTWSVRRTATTTDGRRPRERHLKPLLTDLYQEATLLMNFTALNLTGLLKTVKRHDKYDSLRSLEPGAAQVLDPLNFPAAQGLLHLCHDIETMFATLFCAGSLHLAKTEMLVKRQKRVNWALVDIGVRMGCMLMLLIWFLWDVFVDASAHPTRDTFHLKEAVPVFRTVGSLLALAWLWIVQTAIYRAARINYAFVLDSDVRFVRDQSDLLREVSTASVIYLALFLLYFKTLRKDSFASMPPNLFPLLLCVFLVYKLVWPWNHRRLLWKSALHVAVSPFGHLSFRESFVADIFTSMVKVWTDLAFSVCFFASGEWHDDSVQSCHDRPMYTYVLIPLVHSLPLWWRFMQTIKQYRDTRQRWPYLGNSFKYAFAQSVILFGVFKPHLSHPSDTGGMTTFQRMWLTYFVCSTLYSFWWDVFMDWGLGKWEHGFLRQRLMFSRRWVYWVAIVADGCLRFCWTFTLIPTAALPSWVRENMDYSVFFVFAVAELFRRSMWAVFRLEWEHLSRTNGGVNLVPLQFDLKAAGGPDGDGDGDEDDDKPVTKRVDGRRVAIEASMFVGAVIALSMLAAFS